MFKSYFICVVSYSIAFFTSLFIVSIFRFLHPLLIIFIADLAATIVIFVFSTIFKNTSLYDPYWSIAPLIISVYYLFYSQINNTVNIRSLVVFILVAIWSIRLTYNWLRQWGGLKHEDWRYMSYRVKMGNNFWIINLVGLQLMPTIMVYLGSLSLYPTFSRNTNSIGFLDVIAIIVTLAAIIIESISDKQLYNFVKNRYNSRLIIKKGLWHYSRHPNYFGEILFWWGLYLFALAVDINFYWAILGPISITILFNLVSIPLMEKRNIERKPDYVKYKKQVSRLIPWFRKEKF